MAWATINSLEKFIRKVTLKLSMGTAYSRGKKAGLPQSVHELNAEIAKKRKPKSTWAAGGHAPNRGIDPFELAQYLKRLPRK